MKEKKKPGRKPLDIKPEQVEKLASYGLNNTQIADCLGCEDSSIGNKFRESVIKGKANLIMKLSQKQIEVALGGNVSMLIWLGKQYLGQSDTREEDKPISEKITITLPAQFGN